MKKLLLLLLLFFLPSLGNSSTLDFSDLTPQSGGRMAIDVDGFEIFIPTISSFTPIVSTDPDIYKFKLFASQLPPELELVVVYLSFEDKDRMWNGEEPTLAEVVQITTISNDGEDVPYSFFEKDVENSISMLLKAEEALEPALAEITKQEAKVSSGVAEDKTIRVLMPSGPFIYEDNALSYTFIDFTHQTKDNQITETGRLITTLIIFFENRFINVGFYKTTSQESTADDLASEKEKAKDWYKSFLRIQETNDLIWKGYEAIDKEQYDLARLIFLPLAKQGDISALYGMYYTYDPQCKFPCKSPMVDKKIYWLTKIAEQGDLDAPYELGLLYLTKSSLNDYQIAFNIFLQLAEKGDAKAQEKLGFMYKINAIGDDEKNEEKEIYWYTKAAEQGHDWAQLMLGSGYDYGFSDALLDEEKAFYWYKKAAEQGNPEAQYQMIGAFNCGSWGTEGCEQQIYWLTKCAETYYLCPDALDRAKQFKTQSEATLIKEGKKAYDNGNFYPEAHDIWLPLARQGNAEAQFHMSLLGGVGIEYLAAKRWLTLSAEQGYAPAIYRLADNYIIGTEFRGYKKDYKKAINLYTQAAEMGHIPSQNALGEFNSYGTYSVLKNPKKGVYWYEKAANQGSARAQYSLGIIYMGNDGIPQDDKKSFYWTKKAAEQGYTLAEYNLGGYYIMGKGVIKSFKDAAYWVKKAYEGGHDNAEKMWNKYELWKYE